MNGQLYYDERNEQNDIIGILDGSGSQMVNYSYDSWGKLLNISGSLASTVGAVNPFRYRGYSYDTETGLFYVASRYYDPNTGRFLNADDTDTLGSDKDNLLSENLFAYCENNPVNKMDPSGNGPEAAVLGLPLLGLGPIGWVAYGALVAVAVGGTIYAGYLGYNVASRYIHFRSRTKAPTLRPQIKGQGREQGEKKKGNNKWEKNSNKKPLKQPRVHHPSKVHRKSKIWKK